MFREVSAQNPSAGQSGRGFSSLRPLGGRWLLPLHVTRKRTPGNLFFLDQEETVLLSLVSQGFHFFFILLVAILNVYFISHDTVLEVRKSKSAPLFIRISVLSSGNENLQ